MSTTTNASAGTEVSTEHGDALMCFGAVVDIKAVKSLGVTRITIEIPAEHHVRATGAFYDKQVMLFPVTPQDGAPPMPYGVMSLGEFNKRKGQAPKPSTPPAPAAAVVKAAAPVPRSAAPIALSRPGVATDSGTIDDVDTDHVQGGDAPTHGATPRPVGLQPRRDDDRPRNYAAQAGILCSHPSFWEMLGAKLGINIANAEDAATHLRDHLRIESRAWLNPGDPHFDRQVNSRFTSLVREHESFLNASAQDA